MFQLENGSARIEAFGNPVLRTTSAAPVREADDVAFVLDADDKVGVDVDRAEIVHQRGHAQAISSSTLILIGGISVISARFTSSGVYLVGSISIWRKYASCCSSRGIFGVGNTISFGSGPAVSCAFRSACPPPHFTPTKTHF